jgi:pyruvate/2-oxoglutarate dehydrogenase complex dihydrolipoamide acyltransferase (E2) component
MPMQKLINKARKGKLEISDFQDTTISITNPGYYRDCIFRATADEGSGSNYCNRCHQLSG